MLLDARMDKGTETIAAIKVPQSPIEIVITVSEK
jgi:hypothetical protein